MNSYSFDMMICSLIRDFLCVYMGRKSEFYNDEFVPLSSLPFAVQEEPVLSPRTEVTQGTVALPPETPREEPIDPSLLLAMQLQQEEEQSFIQHTAGAAAEPIIQPAAIQFTAPPPAQSTVPPSNLSSSITHLPTALDYIVSPSAVSLAGTTAAMPAGPDPTDHHAVAQQLGLTAEEYDHQIAMVLYWEEKNQKSEESASRRELLSPTVTAPQQPPSPTVAVGNSNSNPQARKQKKATSSSDSSRRENSNPNSSNCTVN